VSVHHHDERVTVHHGDCLDVLRTIPDSTVAAIVTDPPYGLGFMGKAWDDLPPGEEWARECLRVLKPGGHLLAFGGARTWHRLAVAVEDAGFEVRDSIAWLYGSGFPKSLDVSKAIDKAAVHGTRPSLYNQDDSYDVAAPATPAAQQWQGWGTALKPAFEPIVVARKPLVGTVAANVLAHGTGALNVDATRVGLDGEKPPTGSGGPNTGASMEGGVMRGVGGNVTPASGRWPANVLLDGDAAAELDEQSGDTGGASRFFPTFRYQAKAPTRERVKVGGVAHPTVKPLALMRWLVRLVTPPGGLVLDPFAGSGTTVEAALLEGVQCIAVEREAEYLPLIADRIERQGGAPTATPGDLLDLDDEGAA